MSPQEENKLQSRMGISPEESPIEANHTISNNINTNTNSSGTSFMSTINNLKKKWNDVSNKTRTSHLSHSPDPIPGKNTNQNISNDPNINRLNEIKSKYNMSKLKNVNLNTSYNKK